MAYRHHVGVYDPKYRSNRQRREMEDMLSEWYGSKFAANEITNRTDEPQKLGDLLQDILEDKLNDAAMMQLELREKWESLIGPPLNRFTRFAAIRENIAIVEVSHPAFLLELRRNKTGELWCKKLQELFPALEIEAMQFVPAGSQEKQV